MDQVAVAVIDEHLSVSLGVDLGLYQAPVVVGVEGLLILVHLVGLVYPVDTNLGQAVHGIVGERAAGSGCVYTLNDVSVAVQYVLRGVAVAVLDCGDPAVLVVGE